MRNKKMIITVIIITVLIFILLAIFAWINYWIPNQKSSVDPVRPLSRSSDLCGMENCHGLDISCGSNIPNACTEIYMAGDNCRQFADCRIINGKCALKTTPQFDNCKACVEKCERDFVGDQIGFFQCESNCGRD